MTTRVASPAHPVTTSSADDTPFVGRGRSPRYIAERRNAVIKAQLDALRATLPPPMARVAAAA